MQKIINIIYICIIILELFLFKMYIDENNEKTKTKEEINSIEYILNQGKKYNKLIDEKKVINYEMILEIPQINLKRGILLKTDDDNNIDKNVTILNISSYPNEEGNVFLAAHSGNGNKSYFNDLIYLKENDIAFIYYKNKKYTYSLAEVKNIDKNENVTFPINSNNNLILITCNQKEKSKYLFFIFTLKAET